MESDAETSIRGLLRSRLLRTQFLSRYDECEKSRNDHRIRRSRLTEHQQPRHSAGHFRLAANFLEASALRRATNLRSVFLFNSRSLVCGSRLPEECTSQYGLRRFPIRLAVERRNASARAVSKL